MKNKINAIFLICGLILSANGSFGARLEKSGHEKLIFGNALRIEDFRVPIYIDPDTQKKYLRISDIAEQIVRITGRGEMDPNRLERNLDRVRKMEFVEAGKSIYDGTKDQEKLALIEGHE